LGAEQAAERRNGGGGFVFDPLGNVDDHSSNSWRDNRSATPVVVASVDAAPDNRYGDPLYSFHPQFLEKPPFFNGLLAGYDSSVNGGFIMECSPSGTTQWTVLVSNAPNQCISVDSSNFAYVTGQFNGTANFGATNLNANGGVFLAKYDISGNNQWATAFGGSGSYSGQGNGVLTTSLGETYLTGDYYDTFGGSENLFLLKLGFSNDIPGSVLGIQMYPGITINGLAGRLYQIQATESIPATNWQVLTNLVLPYSPYVWVDTSAEDSASRLYRAVLIQP
jgi:hypothetical protein